MIDKETKLSVREFILIVTMLVTAMSSWIPKLTVPTVTPEMATLRTEFDKLREERLVNDENEIRDLHVRVRELERQKGYDNDDPGIYSPNGSRRRQPH